MSETNSDSFKAEMIAEIKKIQTELNELKEIKKNIVKKSDKKTAAKRKAVKRKTVKRNTTRRE